MIVKCEESVVKRGNYFCIQRSSKEAISRVGIERLVKAESRKGIMIPKSAIPPKTVEILVLLFMQYSLYRYE